MTRGRIIFPKTLQKLKCPSHNQMFNLGSLLQCVAGWILLLKLAGTNCKENVMTPLWLSCNLQKRGFWLFWFFFWLLQFILGVCWHCTRQLQQQPLSSVQPVNLWVSSFYQNHERFCTQHCNFSRMSVFKYNFKTHIYILTCEKHLNNTKKKKTERPAPAYPPHPPCQRYQTPF